jgi:fumarylacetoacetase
MLAEPEEEFFSGAEMSFDDSTNPGLKSWVESANNGATHFPIQNLPYGVFTTAGNPTARVGVAIGDAIVDLAYLEENGWLKTPAKVFAHASLNAFIGQGRDTWRSVRAQLSALLRHDNPSLRDNADACKAALVDQRQATMLLPAQIPGYTDFYSSREHATNVGALFRDPKNALMPNWLELPVGYNGRASSVVVSGTPVRRPNGQIKLPNQERPVFSPCLKLDIELETGFLIGQGNSLGEPIACTDAEAHIFGMVLLNDWSARDLQAWEYVPLGPFNAKGFATTISPWVVTMDALEPFRVAQPVQDPVPLPYLRQQGDHAFDIQLEASFLADGETEATTFCHTNFKHLYWSMAQQLTHHTVSGCNTRVGDLMGSGTISGPTPDSLGSLLELTTNGKTSIKLASGASRSFIEDGDTMTLTGWCQGNGYRVGFGSCSGKVLPAHPIADK